MKEHYDFSKGKRGQFNNPDAVFKQRTIALVLCRSLAWCERARWAGDGPKYLKVGRSVLYRKADVVAWLDSHGSVSSTAEYPGSNAHLVAA